MNIMRIAHARVVIQVAGFHFTERMPSFAPAHNITYYATISRTF